MTSLSEISSTEMEYSGETTIGRWVSACAQIGVMAMALMPGVRIEPPAGHEQVFGELATGESADVLTIQEGEQYAFSPHDSRRSRQVVEKVQGGSEIACDKGSVWIIRCHRYGVDRHGDDAEKRQGVGMTQHTFDSFIRFHGVGPEGSVQLLFSLFPVIQEGF